MWSFNMQNTFTMKMISAALILMHTPLSISCSFFFSLVHSLLKPWIKRGRVSIKVANVIHFLMPYPLYENLKYMLLRIVRKNILICSPVIGYGKHQNNLAATVSELPWLGWDFGEMVMGLNIYSYHVFMAVHECICIEKFVVRN